MSNVRENLFELIAMSRELCDAEFQCDLEDYDMDVCVSGTSIDVEIEPTHITVEEIDGSRLDNYLYFHRNDLDRLIDMVAKKIEESQSDLRYTHISAALKAQDTIILQKDVFSGEYHQISNEKFITSVRENAEGNNDVPF